MSKEDQAAAVDPRLSTKQYLEKHQLDELLKVLISLYSFMEPRHKHGSMHPIVLLYSAAPMKHLLFLVSTEAQLLPVLQHMLHAEGNALWFDQRTKAILYTFPLCAGSACRVDDRQASRSQAVHHRSIGKDQSCWDQASAERRRPRHHVRHV